VLRRIKTKYGHHFPNLIITKNGSKIVHDFGIKGASSISLEKEHGSRDSIPPTFVKYALNGLADVISHLELTLAEEQNFCGVEDIAAQAEESPGNGRHPARGTARKEDCDEPRNEYEAEARILPKTELPD
jgi:hypothetical protein